MFQSVGRDSAEPTKHNLTTPRSVAPPALDGLAHDFFESLSHLYRSPTKNGFPGENGERDPDKAKGDEMTARERFVIKKDAEEERAGRREVLQEPNRGEPQITRGVTEPKERNGGDNTGGDEQDRQPPTVAIENQCAVRL